MKETILYRLIDPHSQYGSAGRSYYREEYISFPYYDRPLFEKINTADTDYQLTTIQNGHITEIYFLDPA